MGLLSWLWSEPASDKVLAVEQEAPSFEQRLVSIVQNSRGLSSRTQQERQKLMEDVAEALDILESAISVLEAADLADRAKNTRTRLRSIRTRVAKAA